jgi:hypothetical protein
MSLISEIIQTHLPARRKKTPSGWASFNAICCHHRGHKRDAKGRAGLIVNGLVTSYCCFNCGFKISWQPGRRITFKMKQFLEWIGVEDAVVRQIEFDILRLNQQELEEKYDALMPSFKTIKLPPNTQPLRKVKNQDVIPVLEYMIDRDLHENDITFMWSDDKAYRDRLIIPFYYDSRLVGYTARTCKLNKNPRYLTSSQPGYVFNLDKQPWHRDNMILCEGPIDALHVGGIATMGGSINDSQRLLISTMEKNVIVVPDRDSKGEDFVEQSILYNWEVSMPDWADGIKDIGDAVAKYGRTLTLYSIMKSRMSTELKIRLRMKKWFG